MNRETLQRLNAARVARRATVVATDLGEGEARLFVEGNPPDESLSRELAEALRSGRSAVIEKDGRRVFLNAYLPAPRLVLIGAVHISQALAPMATLAGYRVEVIDPRTAFATPERFPDVLLEPVWPDEALARRPLDRHTALAALTHDPRIDDGPLAAALAAGCFYVGALGSRRTHARRLERLRLLGIGEQHLASIDAPIGLDIAASSPAEIAVAVLGAVVRAWRTRPVDPAPSAKGGSKVHAVVLAGGMSSRMGTGNKLLATFDGEPLVRRVVRQAQGSGAAAVHVVTGHQGEQIAAALAGLEVALVRNPEYASGLASSLKAGLSALPPEADGALVVLGDMPAVTSAHLARLIGAFRRAGGAAVVRATHEGRRGNPVILPRSLFAEAMKLRGDVGARALIESGLAAVVDVELGDAAADDVDTPEALAKAGGTPADGVASPPQTG